MRTTRSMTLDAARQAVLSTTELLEAIIVCLPYKQVFTVQRVCRRFRECVSSSTQIQQKLFLRPYVQKESWMLRPPGLEGTAPLIHIREYELVPATADVTHVVSPGIILPTMLSPLATVRYRTAKASTRQYRWAGEILELDMKSLVREPGSWQAIYLTDPPCTTSRFSLSFGTNGTRLKQVHGSGCGEMESKNGITLGDLYEAAIKARLDSVFPRDSSVNFKKGSTIQDIFAHPQCTDGDGAAGLNYLHLEVYLDGVAVPSMQEWEEVRRKVQKA